jgi:hypothetical protein
MKALQKMKNFKENHQWNKKVDQKLRKLNTKWYDLENKECLKRLERQSDAKSDADI